MYWVCAALPESKLCIDAKGGSDDETMGSDGSASFFPFICGCPWCGIRYSLPGKEFMYPKDPGSPVYSE